MITGAAGQSSITAALRDQLRTQKRRYETDITALKTKSTQLKRDLAAATEKSTASARPETP